jgi:zinc protease
MNKASFFGFLFFVLMAAVLWPIRSAQAEEIVRAKLANGLRVVIVRNPLVPVATTVVNYLVGSNEAPTGFPGMAHAQEHMMFRGNPGLTADQLARITAEMGGQFGADTQQNVTQYFFTVPTEDLDVALHIEAIRMKGVLDSEKLWNEERGAIEQEVSQDLSSPEYVFYMRLLAGMFAGTPYEHDALGTRLSFDKTTSTMLKKFYNDWYVPNNAVLIICGDVNPARILKKVKELFGDIPARELPTRQEVKLEPIHSDIIRMDTDRPYGMVSFAFRMPGYDSPDYAACMVLADVLNSQRGDLYSLVVDGKALFADFELDPLTKAGLGYVVAGFPSGSDSEKLLSQVRSVLLTAIKNGVSADLVSAAQLHEVTQAEFKKNSIRGLATSWSHALAVEGRQSPDEDIQAIQQVTVEDVNRMATKYLDLGHSIEAILTPRVSGNPISSKGFGGRESLTVAKPVNVKLPEWARKALSRLSVPRSTLHPVVSTFRNGLRLIVQPETISNTVSVYGRVKSNPAMQTPKGQVGVDSVLKQLFSYGSTSLDRMAFQKALDDIGATEFAGADFQVKVTPNHFERGVQLLAENELHPALPDDAFNIIKTQTAASVAGTLKSPGFLSEQALKTGLFPKGDPSLRYATPNSISALTLDDLKAYYRSVFRPDMTTIIVIGNITPKGVRKVIEKYFGLWKSRGAKPLTDFPVVPDNEPSFITIPDSSRLQDIVTMAQTLRLNRTDPNYYLLELGNSVLGGAFYATKLYQDLRENTGLVYYVDSDLDAGQHRSVFHVVFACDSDKVSKSVSIVRRDLNQMQKFQIPKDQLHQTKALLLRKIPLAESSIDSIAGGLIYRTINNLPLDEQVREAKRYIRLTGLDVKKAFSKWIRPDGMVEVTKGPTPQ